MSDAPTVVMQVKYHPYGAMFLVCTVRFGFSNDFGGYIEGHQEVNFTVTDEAEGDRLAQVLADAGMKPLRLMTPNHVIRYYEVKS